jgi:phosphotransferase system enzyme I (PtsI)
MFPMVSGLSELTEAKSVLAQVEKELTLELIPHKKNIRIGSMIEVPSAAIISDLLAKECDFLSIGTNDLVQYSLAVDRGNQHLSNFYTPSHPGVLRLIKMIVTEANRQGIPVTVCGEIAADPRFTPLLLGLGVHELSVSSRYIPIVKQMVRSTSIVQASHLAEKALSLGSPHEIEELLELEYRKTAPEPLITSELIS